MSVDTILLAMPFIAAVLSLFIFILYLIYKNNIKIRDLPSVVIYVLFSDEFRRTKLPPNTVEVKKVEVNKKEVNTSLDIVSLK